MPAIKKIQIRNFRSIVNQTIDVANFNVFVGLNDAGKSNVLKALNLFFNGKTDGDKSFDFYTDYSKHSQHVTKKADEILVALTIETPSTYADQEVVWTKCWRKDGERTLDNEGVKVTLPLQAQNQGTYTKSFLKRIQYKYVPAIKGDDFFTRLLGELYLSVSTEQNDSFIQSMQDYAVAIQNYTQSIAATIKSRVDLESLLSVPQDQRSIFSSLIFNTKSDTFDILLQQRGDGIKTRHIPAILKFMSEHLPKEKHQKAPYTTIWGYEEPEASLELSKCFDMANEFKDYSKNIQIFLTTHSPSFYLLSENTENTDVKRFLVHRDVSTTSISDNPPDSKLNDTLGLMPIVAPYIKQAQEEQSKAKAELVKIMGELENANKPLLFVEGDYDIRYLEKAAELLNQHDLLNAFKVIDSTGCGNMGKVKNDTTLVSAMQYKIVLLYDYDVKKQDSQDANLFVRSMPFISENPIKKGIENLFAKPILEKAMQEKSAFIDITAATKKTERGEEKIIPEQWEVNKDEKKNLCDWIVANGTEDDFQKFHLVFDILKKIQEGQRS